MDLPLPRNATDIREYLRNPLYRNSVFLALSRFTDVAFGFLFWNFAARLYSVADVGIATALISSLGLVIAFSRLGFDTAMIRFMPTKDRGTAFSTSLWITLAAALVTAIIYLVLVPSITPEIAFIRNYALIFILFAVANSFELTAENAFLSMRRADLKWILHLTMGIRILLLIPFAFLGSFGILSAVGAIYAVASLLSIFLIARLLPVSFSISCPYLEETFRFSFLNYIASLLATLPTLVLPIMILNLLGPESSALYYIAFSIGNLVLIIPDAMTMSFFVEGSHGVNLRKAATLTLVATYAILLPTIVVIFFFGDLLLGLFGSRYVEALDLLRIIAISAVFVTIYNLFIPIQNIRFRVKGIVLMNLARAVLLLGTSYIFMKWFGLIGAGYAWLGTYAVLATGIVIFKITFRT